MQGVKINNKYPFKYDYTYNCAKTVLEQCIGAGKTRFVLYPYGEIAKFIEKVIHNEYNMDIQCAIDTMNSNSQTVFSITEAQNIVDKDCVILICSDNRKYYEEIRRNIYEAFDREQVVDVFPVPDDDELDAVVKWMDEIVERLDL